MTDRPSGDDLRRALSHVWLTRRAEVTSMVASAADLSRRIAHGQSTDWASLRATTHQLVGIVGVYRLNDLRALVVSVDEVARVGDDRSDAAVIADRLVSLRDAAERHPGPSATGEDQ